MGSRVGGSVWQRRSLRFGQGILVVFAAFVCATALVGPLTAALIGAGLVSEGSVEWYLARTVFQFVGFAVAVGGYVAVTRDWRLLTVRRPTVREGLVIVAGVLALLGLQFGFSAVASAIGVGTGQNRAIEFGQANPDFFLYMIVVSVLVVGPVEELVFRGMLQGLLRRAWGAWPAILLASAVFGLVHVFAVAGTTNQRVLYATIAAALGCVLGYLYERTDNLAVPGLAHGVYNATLFVIQYAAIVWEL